MLQRQGLVQGAGQPSIPVRLGEQAYRHGLGVDRRHSGIGGRREEAEEQMVANCGIGFRTPGDASTPATTDALTLSSQPSVLPQSLSSGSINES